MKALNENDIRELIQIALLEQEEAPESETLMTPETPEEQTTRQEIINNKRERIALIQKVIQQKKERIQDLKERIQNLRDNIVKVEEDIKKKTKEVNKLLSEV